MKISHSRNYAKVRVICLCVDDVTEHSAHWRLRHLLCGVVWRHVHARSWRIQQLSGFDGQPDIAVFHLDSWQVRATYDVIEATCNFIWIRQDWLYAIYLLLKFIARHMFLLQCGADWKRVCRHMATENRSQESVIVLRHQPGLFRLPNGRVHDHHCSGRRAIPRKVSLLQWVPHKQQQLDAFHTHAPAQFSVDRV